MHTLQEVTVRPRCDGFEKGTVASVVFEENEKGARQTLDRLIDGNALVVSADSDLVVGGLANLHLGTNVEGEVIGLARLGGELRAPSLERGPALDDDPVSPPEPKDQ